MPETAAPSKLQVGVVYNGMTREVHYNPHEQGRVLFEQACHVFEIPEQERGALGLFLSDNATEVRPDMPVEESGVTPGSTLLLRPREVSTGVV